MDVPDMVLLPVFDNWEADVIAEPGAIKSKQEP